METHSGLCPSCDRPCALTDSQGARLLAFGILLGEVIGKLNLGSDGQIFPELEIEEWDQLAQLADWLQEEGIKQQRREGLPPLRLVSSA